jgi:hypothetical protein
MRCHSSTGASRIGPSSIMPALLTSVSSRPSSDVVRSTAAIACCWSVTSASITSAVPPSSRICLARPSSRSTRRAASATAAPSRARYRAVASPMPLDAPVTRATVPSSRSVTSASVRGWGTSTDGTASSALEVKHRGPPPPFPSQDAQVMAGPLAAPWALAALVLAQAPQVRLFSTPSVGVISLVDGPG